MGHLKVLVVVRIDAETGDKAVHHELNVSILTACTPPEGFGRVEQQSLLGQLGVISLDPILVKTVLTLNFLIFHCLMLLGI